jgi:D-alanine-D-alanine ligase
MRIAFVYNARRQGGELESAYLSPETVALVTEALERAGHPVEPVPIGGPLSQVIARLETLQPDLVLDAARGTRGRHRRALFPALYEQLDLPYVGSDPFVTALAADKGRVKHTLAALGVPVPSGVVVRDLKLLSHLTLAFPVIVKPAYEEASLGISQHSVVERPDELGARVADVLTRWRSGVLIEEYVAGRDVVVPFLQRASPETGGVLPPTEILYPANGRRWPILDHDRRRQGLAAIDMRTPADLPMEQTAALRRLARTVVESLGLRDYASMDFRVTDDGRIWLLDVDPRPDLEAGAPLYRSAALAGLKGVDPVLDALTRGAAERQGLAAARPTPPLFALARLAE